MFKLVFKNPFTIWIQWLIHYFLVKRKYSTANLHYNAFARASRLGQYVTIYENCNLYQCEIDDYTYIAGQSMLLNTRIGKFCSIGPGVRCGLGRHPIEFVSTHPIFFSMKKQAQITFADKNYFQELLPIEIGNDVWIGANAIILDGVKIGDGAIIAAGAVVSKDIPSYAVVAGVPAKIMKYRFNSEQIDFLLEFKWWNKNIQWIRSNWALWHDIKTFISSIKTIKMRGL